MPMFNQPKKSEKIKSNSSSKSSEEKQDKKDCEINDVNEIQLKLGSVISAFSGGVWRNDVTNQSSAQVAQLRKGNEHLHNQNNLIQLKNEILLNMVTSKCMKIQEMEQEINQLQSVLQLQRQTSRK